MEIDVTAAMDNIVIGATGVEEILQNVRTILSTTIYTVPLNRQFGVDADFLDQPEPVAMARANARIVEAVERWEPRVEVTLVKWDRPGKAADGRLRPLVRIRIREGVL